MIRVYWQKFKKGIGLEYLELIAEYADWDAANFHGEYNLRNRCQDTVNTSHHNIIVDIDGKTEKFRDSRNIPISHEWDGTARETYPVQTYIEEHPPNRQWVSSYPHIDIAHATAQTKYWAYANAYGERFLAHYPKVWDAHFVLQQLANIRRCDVILAILGQDEIRITPNVHCVE